jgi:hypothetical protein
MARQTLTAGGFAARIGVALLLVLLTFNPSGYSYLHWLMHQFPRVQPATALAGVALLICWVVYLSAARESLGLAGIALLVAFFAALVWAATSIGVFNLSGSSVAWAAVLVAGIILGLGMCWSHLRRRLTGQIDVDQTGHR